MDEENLDEAESQCLGAGAEGFAYRSVEPQMTIPKAAKIYILLPKNVPISRSTRFQWLLDHLDSIVTIPTASELSYCSHDLEIISAVPSVLDINSSSRQFMVTASTEIAFLSQSYRFVYCLDMSPSQSAVDTGQGQILFDEIINSFRSSLLGLCNQFTVYGSSVVFQPCLFLTVIVNTPFFINPAQQVIVKGVPVSSHNVHDIINLVQAQFHHLEGRIAEVSCRAYEQIDQQMVENEVMVGGLFNLAENDCTAYIPMVSPDANFVNMLRYSMLAISLLPENSLSHIIVITDGVVAMPDSNILESLLYQLHYESIVVSFLKVGSAYKPHTSAGYVPYTDLLIFLSHSTLGSVLDSFPVVKPDPNMHMNVYQELYLLWTFHTKLEAKNYTMIDVNDEKLMKINSNNLQESRIPTLLSKRQIEEQVNCPLSLLVSKRMREGYTINDVHFHNGILKVKLTLHWKTYIFIHYELVSSWPTTKNLTHLEIFVSAPYDFLHDITCIMKKETKSSFRQAVFERFWMRSTQLASNDTLLIQQLSSFQNTNVWYTLPDSVRSGIPVFIINSSNTFESNKFVLTPSDSSCSKFTQIWQPICYVDTSNWRKWFHTHRLSLILKHDHPLPKHMHLSNPSGRYQVIQCRQAATALYGLLNEWSTFVLVDNHTYLKLLYREDDKPPTWFCIIRISSKLPCATINLGFTTGSPGNIRHRVCEDLKLELSSLSYLSTPLKSRDNIGCTIMLKPLEKILIRYERIPNDFHTVIFPDGTQNTQQSLPPSPLAGTRFITLSRYLFHQRWIWSTTHIANQKLDLLSLSRVLSTLTRIRIKEGFNFAHCQSGITTMVLELWMDPNSTCVVQFVLFPAHNVWWSENDTYSGYGSGEDIDQDSESDPDLQVVTEIWIEPQFGRVQTNNPRISYMDGMHYFELADMIKLMDMKCIHALLTLEHLSHMCQNKNKPASNSSTINASKRSFRRNRNSFSVTARTPSLEIPINQWNPTLPQRIQHVPFEFDFINILPMCQQTELIFSMFIEEKCERDAETEELSGMSNKVLLTNMHKQLLLLNDHELKITPNDSDRFSSQIKSRHINKPPHLCPLIQETEKRVADAPHWRCYVKGVSVTHVILTVIPASLQDLKDLTCKQENSDVDDNEGYDDEKTSSRNSNCSDVPMNVASTLHLPVYVYDCPLGVLVESYINNGERTKISIKDQYEDHRYTVRTPVQDSLRLRSDESPNSADSKNDDFESNDPHVYNHKTHCSAIVMLHSKCFAKSLFSALHCKAFIHRSDVLTAMDRCEETLIEINITNYLKTICGHMKHHKTGGNNVNNLSPEHFCLQLKQMHNLIKEKFLKITTSAFHPIPTDREYYYCRNLINNKDDMKAVDSDDEISTAMSEIDAADYKSEREESLTSEVIEFENPKDDEDILKSHSPLFLHFVCTVRYNSQVNHTAVQVLPTCLGELIENFDVNKLNLGVPKLDITLDVLCLTLPVDVQNVISDYATTEFRTSSFCSDGFLPSCSSASETSFSSDLKELDPLQYIPELQKIAINTLKEEIKWLLQDEIATALLDVEPVTEETLSFIMKHVSDGASRPSCSQKVIDLHFVYGFSQSYEKFVREFSMISVPDYKLEKLGDFYYIKKDRSATTADEIYTNNNSDDIAQAQYFNEQVKSIDYDNVAAANKCEDFFSQSDVSSMIGSIGGTSGYEDNEEKYKWVFELDTRRPSLPNFWLITQIENDSVKVYFHCRFLQLPTMHVGVYIQLQRRVLDAIRDLCKVVNQSMLLQSLHDTRFCDFMLEPNDTYDEWPENNVSSTRNIVLSRLKSMEEINDESDISSPQIESSLKFKDGFFSCPVVWEIHFVLHPRLKTGPGKSGLSVGISALKTVLDKFSVTNRNNMFVYKDRAANVFYLRLHENLQGGFNKNFQNKSNEFEQPVSRSPSIASLPIGPQKSIAKSEYSISSTTSSDIRPRVRSFGEKDTKDGCNEDTVTLKVYGISDVGDDIRMELVQVLQNRLDDAVLELLSIMLSRNAMCPLTPEDVHFLQKPFRAPERIIKLSVQHHTHSTLESFVVYLKQNLLQFLNLPKYTDARSHFHFKDYTDSDQINKTADDSIFIYNQSQNPSSGNRGIACIALAVVGQVNINLKQTELGLHTVMSSKDFERFVTARVLDDEEALPDLYLEFRIWKQGRVNDMILHEKLCAAASHATWDFIMEYFVLKHGFCVEINNEKSFEIKNTGNRQLQPSDMGSNETILDVILDTKLETLENSEGFKRERKDLRLENTFNNRKNRRTIPKNSAAQRSLLGSSASMLQHNSSLEVLETGSDGKLNEIYQSFISEWLKYASDRSVPSVRCILINLTHPNPLHSTIREMQAVIGSFPQETIKCFMTDVHSSTYVPYVQSHGTQKVILISRNFDHWKVCNQLVSDKRIPEVQSTQSLKHFQKFPHAVVNARFIPRQKLLWGSIECDRVKLYVYNWSKENIIKLRNHCSNVGQWMNVRASVLNSCSTQRMGLFHNQAIDRKPVLASNNPYVHCIGDVESMVKFPKDRSRRIVSSDIHPLEIFRDNYWSIRFDCADPVIAFTIEMVEIKKSERKQKDELKKLFLMYQSRSNTSTLKQMQMLLQNSRIIHYCHTPLLFLSRWRLEAAATRDHSIMTPLNYAPLEDTQYKSEEWHEDLYESFVTEYKRYLQSLGFMSLEWDSPSKKRNTKKQISAEQDYMVYMQKTILGGILLFTIQLMEPFFITKLHAVECNRIQSSNSRTSINQFTQSFLDECDRIKVFMHLHSFTYDFHLRSIFNYISNNSAHKVCEGYHLIHFLDDFMKYYNKAPNYARNLVHADSIIIRNLLTEGKQLYTYLLSNVDQYNLNVVSMQKVMDVGTEYVLVQVSSISGVSYKDSQDRQHTDDFDITLIISNIFTSVSTGENVLHLKYYLILTSRREIYPKTEMERKLGKFRTVSSTSRNINVEQEWHRQAEDNEQSFSEKSSDKRSESDKSFILSIYPQSTTDDETNDEVKKLRSMPHPVQIKQESVNYLGYYSSHEQLMQQLILNCADNTQKTIREMVTQGMVHCRTHLLWNKLLSQQESSQLTYMEFIELKGLSKLESLCDVHPNLGTLINQPFNWYQGLAKVLLNKYQDQHRAYCSDDGNIQHYVILHPRYEGAFMMLSIDMHTMRGDLYAVYRGPHKSEDSDISVSDRKTLLDGFINCICFYLWNGMI